MKKNVGKTDKVIRYILAAVIAVMIITGNLSGIAAVIAGILGLVLLVTGIIGWCSIYTIFGISTIKKQ